MGMSNKNKNVMSIFGILIFAVALFFFLFFSTNLFNFDAEGMARINKADKGLDVKIPNIVIEGEDNVKVKKGDIVIPSISDINPAEFKYYDFIAHPTYPDFAEPHQTSINDGVLTISDRIIYNKGYYVLNNQWREFTLQGDFHPDSDYWLLDSASVYFFSLNGFSDIFPQYVLIYSCSLVNNAWDCHWDNPNNPKWQLNIIEDSFNPNYFCGDETCDWDESCSSCPNDCDCDDEECSEGEIFCDDEALICSKNGGTSILEVCPFGCNDDENECIKFESLTGNCVEAILGNNRVDDDRINIVFVGYGYKDLETFEFFVDSAIDYDSNFYGLLSVEPFKSNKDKFNFWYVDEVVNVDESMREESGKIKRLFVDVSMRDLPLICNYSNQVSIVLVNSFGFSLGPPGYATVSWVDKNVQKGDFPSDCSLSDVNNDGCVNKDDLQLIQDNESLSIENFMVCYSATYGCHFNSIPEDDRVFHYKNNLGTVSHEFGHSFGLLKDEYYLEMASENQYVSSEGDNCFSAETKEECLENTYWKDLLGQGCGDESIIDCNPEDKDYSLEIGCFEGCYYKKDGIYRPALLSMMGTGILGLDRFTPYYSYRLVNERILCKRILEVTGSTSGYCDKFNLS